MSATTEGASGEGSSLGSIVSRLNTPSTAIRIRLLDELKQQGKLRDHV